MELGLLSNALLNPSVNWTTLLPPLFSGLAGQPGVRTVAPPPLAWERWREWGGVRSQLKACDALFWVQLSSRPSGAIHFASYVNLRARRSNLVVDAWKSSLTKIGIAATIERLDPCFVAFREATEELQRRFPLARFVWLPFGADTDTFYPRKEGKPIFAFSMGRRHEPLHQALLAYCDARRLRYVHSNGGGLSTDELGRLTSSAQYFLATPPDLDNPKRTGGLSPLVMRYFEGLAAGNAPPWRLTPGAANMRRCCRPTRSAGVSAGRFGSGLNAPSMRIEATRIINKPSTPPARLCANIIPGDAARSKFSIISPMAAAIDLSLLQKEPQFGRVVKPSGLSGKTQELEDNRAIWLINRSGGHWAPRSIQM